MGIKLSKLNLAVSLNLPNAYVRVDRVTGGKLDGQVRNLDHGSILGSWWIGGCLDIQ